MAYARSPPRSPSSQEDWLSRGPQSIKTYSTGSSRSHASRSHSLASASSRAYSNINFENAARTYYNELKTYLTDLIAQEAIEGPHPQRVAARQKLTRLSNLQFHELAMDVYDEVVRRKKNDKYMPFLPVKEEFHPKRNQARQKLATLPITRFQDLASDVYFELARRYSNIVDNEDNYLPPVPQIPSPSYDNDTNPHSPQPSKATNIVPVKGMISVENVLSDEESPTSPKYRPSATEKDFFSRSEDDNNNKNKQSDIEKMKADYEYQISNMSKRIKQLQSESNEFAAQKDKTSGRSKQDRDLIDELKRKEAEDQKTIEQIEEQYKKLDDKYQALQRDYNQQQDAVRQVKRETVQMLEELKRLARVNEEMHVEKEDAEARIETLTKEAKDWQLKYEKMKIELRSVKAASFIDAGKSQDIIAGNFLKATSRGAVSQDNILTYQASIDDLLTAARSSNPSNVLGVMKTIVTVCRSITENVEDYEKSNNLSHETESTLYELKSRFSNALSDLLTSAKYHANGMGITPVSLLDNSAGHLTSVIVELAKLLGMSPSNRSNNDYSLKSSYSSSSKSDYFSKSDYSPKSDYSSTKNDYASKSDTLSPSELTNYLKSETDNIIQTIQSLLAALRLPQQNGEVHSIIGSLIKIVSTISELTQATCESHYQYNCNTILSQLGKCAQRLSAIQSKYFTRGAVASATVKHDLAKEAYEIAKFTKELINLFESK